MKLAAELGADRSARSRDQYPFPFEVAGNLRQMFGQSEDAPAEEVVDIDLPDSRDLDLVIQHLEKTGNDLDLETRLLAYTDDPSDILGRSVSDGDDRFFHRTRLGDLRDLLRVS